MISTDCFQRNLHCPAFLKQYSLMIMSGLVVVELFVNTLPRWSTTCRKSRSRTGWTTSHVDGWMEGQEVVSPKLACGRAFMVTPDAVHTNSRFFVPPLFLSVLWILQLVAGLSRSLSLEYGFESGCGAGDKILVKCAVIVIVVFIGFI